MLYRGRLVIIAADLWIGSYINLADAGGSYDSSGTGQFNTGDWHTDYTKPQSFNGWSYTEGNPINRTDTSGHQSIGTPSSGLPQLCPFNVGGFIIWLPCVLLPPPSPTPPPNPQPWPFPTTDWWTCTSQSKRKDEEQTDADPRLAHYRAIDQTELVVVLATGTYGSNPSSGGKYFALTEEGARRFAKSYFNRGRRMTTTSITVPYSFFLDNGQPFPDVGGAGSSVFYAEEVLPELYQVMTPIEILGPP